MNEQFRPQLAHNPSPNIILAVVSVGLAAIGICGLIPTLIISFCGVFPIALGIAAIVTGLLAKMKAKNDPQNWGGAGLALGGVIAGAFCVVVPALYIILMMVLWFGIAAMGQPGR